MHRKSVFLGLILVFVVIVAFTGTLTAQDDDSLYNDLPIYEGDALALDAQEYAEQYGVDLEEAIDRLRLQEPAGELDAELVAKEADTFAGAWIQHKPEFRIIVQFTHDGEDTIRPYIENAPLADLVEVRTASVTLAELETTQEAAWLAVRGLEIPVASGINVYENHVELYVIERDQFNSALQAEDISLPDNVEVITVTDLGTDEAEIFAGLALSLCTSGFSVKNSSGTKGITTAAHCDSNPIISYQGTNLPFQAAAEGGQYDVQWRTAPGFTVRNLMNDGTYYRYVYSTKHRNNQMMNEYICKRGKETGFGCGNIINKNHQPACVTKPDGTIICFTSTFIRVHRDGVNLSSGGDSGGPWFSGNTAYGIMRGSLGDDATYMAINYVSYLGLTVLTN